MLQGISLDSTNSSPKSCFSMLLPQLRCALDSKPLALMLAEISKGPKFWGDAKESKMKA